MRFKAVCAPCAPVLLLAAGVLITSCSSTPPSSKPSCDTTCRSNLVAAIGTPTMTATATETVTATVTAHPVIRRVIATRTRTDTVTYTPPPPKPKRSRFVTYRVTGSASASSVTYTVSDNVEQATSVGLPWQKRITLDEVGIVAQVSAQNGGGGSITCEIINIDGSVLSKHTSTGSYAVVSCSSSAAG